MNNKIFLTLSLAILCAASCNKVPTEPESPDVTGFYVLNNGSWGNNDATLGIYDSVSKTLAGSAFSQVNGQKLGDLGQDMLKVGQHIYISVNGSKTIFVTDEDLKIVRSVTASEGGVTLSPRCLTSGGGKVYVTYYDGYLGEIDPETYAVRTVAVGPNPDGCAYLGGKVYTADSGGYLYPAYNNTVSVVDCATFKVEKTITVNVNPALVKACEGKVYVLSYGDYGMNPSMVQCIDAATGAVSDTGYDSPSSIDLCGDKLYVLCAGYDEQWNVKPGSVYVHDAGSNTRRGEFIKDGTQLSNSYSISAAGGYVFIGCSDYVNSGDIYVIDAETGRLYDKFDSQGINPQKVI